MRKEEKDLEENYIGNHEIQEMKPKVPMKWHCFLVYFWLWLEAFLLFAGALRILGDADSMKSFYAQNKSYEICLAITCVVVSAYAVFVLIARSSLARYKKNGPKLLLYTYFLEIAVSIVLVLLFAIFTDMSLGDFKNAGIGWKVIGNIVMAIISSVYYENRKDLFVN